MSVTQTQIGEIVSVSGNVISVQLSDSIKSNMPIIDGVVYRIGQIGSFFKNTFVMAILNVDYGYSSTAKNGLMQREFSDQQRSTMGSIVSLAGSLCFSIISVLLGYIADITTPVYAMLFGLSGNIIVIWIYTALFSSRNATTL